MAEAPKSSDAMPHRAEDGLDRRAEARVRDQMWQVSQDMLGVADTQGVWIGINPAWTRILGWSADAIIGQTSEWMGHPADRRKVRVELASLVGGMKTKAFESRLRAQDGSYRIFSWTAVPVEGLIYCVARDVTSERERDVALRDAGDFARLALSAVSGVGVWTYDIASDRFFCDAGISDLYGLDPVRAAAGILRVEFLANVHPDDVPALRATMSGGLNRSGDLELEYRIRHPDGSVRWVQSRGHTYFDPDGTPRRRTGVGIDVTQQRRLEEQLRQSQKMEAVGQLIGGVAHDFNNLLTVIQSSVDLLKRPNLAEARRARYIDAISDTTTRAAKLTGQLLAFARQQPLQPEVFDVAQSVLALGDMVATLTGSRITVETRVPDHACLVNADASQFDTALVNVVVNARDAMDGAGVLTIVVGATAEIPAMRTHPPIPGEYVTVTITDTGSGIGPGDLDRIFEPFFTTKGVGHGTGLGLSQVFGFVKQSGGEVAVDSTVGVSTTFTLYLPRVQDAVLVLADDADEAPLVDGHGTCVLVVEDNADVGAFATQTLEELGYVTVLAADAEAALAMLATGSGRFDVVFSDIVMPGMNGIELGQEIRRRHPGLAVVLTSGYSHVLAQNGTFGFELLQKPYSIEQLSRVLQKAAHWRRRMRAGHA
ncbi:PAS domain-containing sensor histidine kinase [Beijerinckia sp. L45]|uniref:hybrid sensor histidine kinase/response regulator n=1 Tax=Beijerinckia sp. L45 TaxID=1641855 RepID=UPI00131C1CC5|nr:PAS domain-containing protein [Beijerinckia sp. L45]